MGWAARTKHRGEPKPPTEEVQTQLELDRLRRLAADIQDEAHFQRLLDTMTDGAMKVEFERLVRPMLLFTTRVPAE